METRFIMSRRFRIVTVVLILIGAVSLGAGFFINPQQAWANILLNNYYFLSLSIGASFFLALQYITQSGWSSMFKRVPESMGFYLPVAAIFMLLMFFGMDHLYHWAHHDASADPVIAHKSAYLNQPFFFIRIIIYFALWIIMFLVLRRLSLREDIEGGMACFEKSEFYSKVFIFFLAITFSLASFDWIMSIDVHWYSNIFALKNFVTAFYHGTAVLILIVILLHERGFYPELNESHLLDFSRYIFMLSIVWGYFWFAQFMLIWYGNIPEETVYFVRQLEGPYELLFYANVILNWLIPFTMLMARSMDKKRAVVKTVAIILIFGQWIDMYTQIFPGTVGKPLFGFVEAGGFLGFAGLFALIVAYGLGRAGLVPKNHPYLDESLHHHVEH